MIMPMMINCKWIKLMMLEMAMDKSNNVAYGWNNMVNTKITLPFPPTRLPFPTGFKSQLMLKKRAFSRDLKK